MNPQQPQNFISHASPPPPEAVVPSGTTVPHRPRTRAHLLAPLLALALLTSAVGCIEHRVKTDPIHITVDVNLRVDEELKEFFAYEEEIERRVIKESPTPPEPPK